MTRETYYISSTNGKNKLHTMVWRPEEVKGILQISHGMIEHIGRYDDFAKFLVSKNILVVGNDHLGHGKTVKCESELGYFDAEDGSKTVVDDLYEVTKKMKQEYPNVPYFVLGHSMGSFMIRRYLMTYGEAINGALIMGTGHQSKVALAAGNIVYATLKVLKGTDYRSKFVNEVILGGYNRKFAPNRTPNDWVSRNEKAVDAYMRDPYCTFSFTINGFKTIFDTFSFINKKSNINKIPKDLPIFFVSGDKDPVGNNGKGVTQIYNTYKALGISKAQLKLYPESRHEILNDLDYKEVYQDIYSWIESNL
nr:alpha/beta fold hydrolase [uncultured Cellulosilyticum sp.]